MMIEVYSQLPFNHTSGKQSAKSVTGSARRDQPRNDVVLIRHGETAWSKAGRFAGLTNLELVPDGEAAAVAARSKLRGMKIDRAAASPLVRATRTAELLGVGPVTLDRRLVERDYGDYEGLTTQQIRERVPGWHVWSDPIPNGESIEAMTERVDSFVQDVRAGRDKLTLVVAHAHLIRLFTARWLGLLPVQAGHFRLGTLGLVHLGWERETPAMHKWNV